MQWDKEAEELLSRAPRWVRPLVRRKIEEFVRRAGGDRVTGEMARRAYQAVRGTRGDDAAVPSAALIAELEAEGKRVAACDEFRTRYYLVQPCAGAAGCPRSLIPVQEVAEAIARELAASGFPEFLERGLGDRPLLSHHRFQVAVAGCPNACSQPQIRDLGVIGKTRVAISAELCTGCMRCVEACGEAAIVVEDCVPRIDVDRCIGCGDCIRVCPTEALRFGEPRYEIVVGGKLGRRPRLGTPLAVAADLAQVIGALRRVLRALMRKGKAGERVGAVMERTGELKAGGGVVTPPYRSGSGPEAGGGVR